MDRKRAHLAAIVLAIVLAVVVVVGAALCWTTAGITSRALYAGVWAAWGVSAGIAVASLAVVLIRRQD